MTNQNDTQDEAERLAINEIAGDVNLLTKIHCLEIPEVALALKRAYRAGVASKEPEIKRCEDHGTAHALKLQEVVKEREALRSELEVMKSRASQFESTLSETMRVRDELREENSRLKESLSAVTVIQQRDAAIKELATSRAEVERLKSDYANLKISHDSYQNGEGNLFLDKVELLSQLTAEKQKAQNLVEILKSIAIVARRHDTGEREYKASDYECILKMCDREIRDYSTDSGDGVG